MLYEHTNACTSTPHSPIPTHTHTHTLTHTHIHIQTNSPGPHGLDCRHAKSKALNSTALEAWSARRSSSGGGSSS